MISAVAPFSVGCFGPVGSVDECRALYSDCDGSTETITAAIQQHNGMATVISAAKIGIYMQKSTAEFMCTGRLKF